MIGSNRCNSTARRTTITQPSLAHGLSSIFREFCLHSTVGHSSFTPPLAVPLHSRPRFVLINDPMSGDVVMLDGKQRFLYVERSVSERYPLTERKADRKSLIFSASHSLPPQPTGLVVGRSVQTIKNGLLHWKNLNDRGTFYLWHDRARARASGHQQTLLRSPNVRYSTASSLCVRSPPRNGPTAAVSSFMNE